MERARARNGTICQQPLAQKLVAAQVNEVPVVYELQMIEVEIDTPLLQGCVLAGVGENLHQRKQCSQPELVVFTADALLQVVEFGLLPARLHHRTRDRHLDSQELVPFSVLPRPRLEETGEPRHLRRIGLGKHICKQAVHFLPLNLLTAKVRISFHFPIGNKLSTSYWERPRMRRIWPLEER